MSHLCSKLNHVSGQIELPKDQTPPSSILNDGRGKVDICWPPIHYTSTGISYTIQILDPSGIPVPNCYKVYLLNDSEPGEHSPLEGCITFTIPEGSQEGQYWIELNYYSKEAGPEIQNRRKIFVAEVVGNLSITKFEDRNNNSYREDNEPGLPGWEFGITDPYGETYTGTTNTSGIIYLPNVRAGNYEIQENLKPEQVDLGWYNTTPLKQIVLVREKKTTYVYFGNNITIGNLTIVKFEDRNNNSIREAGEPGLSGWEFTITQDGRTVATCTTNETGFCVLKLPAGKYNINEHPKPCWKSTTPTLIEKEVIAGQTSEVEFGNYGFGTLLIHKFNDSNQNKVQDDDEEGLANWEFAITQDGREVATCKTNETGFCVLKLPAGKYNIIEQSKPCWKNSTPTLQEAEVIGGKTSEVKFGNYEFGTLLIHKFDDSNRNKVQDDDEEGLANWKFTITQDGGTVDTCKTNETGFCVLELPAGKYNITEKLKEGWISTTPTTQEKEVKACLTTNAEFGNTIPPQLNISKFYDRNQNGKWDKGEEGLENWEFEIKFPDGSIKKVTTGPDGKYKILDPPIGNYTITEQLKPCWMNSTPSVQEVEIKIGQGAEVEFGNYEVGHLKILKFYDPNQNKVQDLDEQGLANWSFEITFPDGSSRRITTDANGTYRLQNIPIGKYVIREEPRSCRWRNSTITTQEVEVTACQETKASFGNYVAPCSIPPGCPWFRSDENLDVYKSVDPCECNITLGKEEEAEVTIYLRICVDPVHIKHEREVKNISVVETLHSQFSVVEDSISEKPKAIRTNPDGTTTIEWDIPSLCCEEWNVSFNVTVALAMPIDVSDAYERVASKVIYEHPIEKVEREISIPEGKLKFRFIVRPPIIVYVIIALLIIVLALVVYMLMRKKR